jgi:hypothetical protein
MAMLNRSLAQAGFDIRSRIHRPALSLSAARLFLVVGGWTYLCAFGSLGHAFSSYILTRHQLSKSETGY